MPLTALNQDEREILLEILWDNSLFGCALVGRDGKFIRVNPAFCQMVEYTEYELQQKSFQDITIPDDVAAETEMAERVAREEAVSYDMMKHYLTKSRHIIRVTLRVFGLRMPDGEFRMFVAQIAPAQLMSPKPSELQIKTSDMALNWWRQNWAMILGWTAAIGAGLAALFRPGGAS